MALTVRTVRAKSLIEQQLIFCIYFYASRQQFSCFLPNIPTTLRLLTPSH